MSLKDTLAAATPGPWQAFKCPCGHKSCDQYTLSVQRSYGLEKPDADLAILAPDMAAALIEAEKVLERIAISNCGCKPHCRCREEGTLIIWKEEAQDEAAAALATIRKVTA